MEEKIAVIATGNDHKMSEFKRMLLPLGYKVYSMKDFNIKDDVVEDGKDFSSNALIKARHVKKFLPNYMVFADDSGLEIDGLNGFPGIYSHRFMEGHPYVEKQQAILDKMININNRKANFTSAIALIDNDNTEHVFIGKVFGEISKEIDGKGGFGYDPIFYSYELKKTFGEATPEEKDSVSHRKNALEKMLNYLKSKNEQ